MSSHPEDSTVRLRIPGKPEYVALARLALSAVCRLTSLHPHDVADLKLAITEAAAELIGPEQAGGEGSAFGDADPGLLFTFELGDGRLVVNVEGEGPRLPETQESHLGRAIIEATANEWDYTERSTRLVKYI